MAEDPREWSADDVHKFASTAAPDEVADLMRRLVAKPDEQAIRVLCDFLGAAHPDLFQKPAPSALATRALISIGPDGVGALRDRLLDQDTRIRYRPNVLAALWQVSRGNGLVDVYSLSRQFGQLLDLELPAGTEAAAKRAMGDVFAEALVDPEAFDLVARFAQNRSMNYFFIDEEDASDGAREIMGLFAEASIKLSRSLLEQFEALLAGGHVEETYQEFLSEHPVLLDPLAAEVVPKQRLGLELATDYAVRSHDGRWLLVEIERPQDEIFTQGNDFRSRFTHAFGQALDFQDWVDHNVAYAQRHMAGITSPKGLVVIGRRSQMTQEQQAKLRRFVDNSRRIEVVTFDDLLARSQSLYENLRHH